MLLILRKQNYLVKSPKNIFDKGAEKVYNNVGFLREIGVFQELGLKNA